MYNVVQGLRLIGPLQLELLEQSLQGWCGGMNPADHL